MIEFRTHPDQYKHWTLSFDGPVATLALDVAEDGGLAPGYELKLNSYDLGVDIELYDAVQRLRFEHPEVGAVVVTSGKDRVFCAGANIKMLGLSSHAHKVNFCKFTNETRNSIEDATDHSHQAYICAVNGTAAGGGYELALATDYILMADDNATAVSLPEVPLLAVLPGTGGLTRVVDKRKVRRDRADFFCTVEEGVKGKRAVDWRLVDEVVPRSRLVERAAEIAAETAARTDRPTDGAGVTLGPLNLDIAGDTIRTEHIAVDIDRALGSAEITISGPADPPPADAAAAQGQGAAFWPLALARELDHVVLHLRFNETEVGTWLFKTVGEGDRVAAYDAFLADHADDWFMREVALYLKDLVYMLDGQFEGDNRPPATVRLTGMNFGAYPMVNGLTRLATRFLDDDGRVAELEGRAGEDLDAAEAEELGLVTFAPDDIDWEDEVRIAVEERAVFSPDALTGMEASLRFAGPETMESKIFSRLTAWQNWIFQRPNAAGEKGALKLYGSGERSNFDRKRV
jgi:benzoyl-CoA-dihydrodiol lyase